MLQALNKYAKLRSMNFWNEEKIKEAIPTAKLYNFPPNWSSCGLIIWQDNIRDDAMVLIRRKGETRGVLPKTLPELLQQTAAFVTTDATEFFKYNKPIIEVSGNGGDAIINLARYIRKNFEGKVCAITGSSGKTTTTRIVNDVLASTYKTSANLNKFNTSWGISWNMTCFDIDSDYWVIETSLGGGMSRNSAITKPDYAIIMNIAPVHLKEGMTLRSIAEEKSLIYNGMKENSTAILYRECEFFDYLQNTAKYKGLNVLTFGENEYCDVRVLTDETNTFVIEGQKYTLNTKPLAKHIMLDMAAAIIVARCEKVPVEKILSTLEKFELIEGRGELTEIKLQNNKQIYIVDESYNANPLSMKVAIEGFSKLYRDKDKMLILGDMAECGPLSAQYHKDLSKTVESSQVKTVMLCGPEMQNLYEEINTKMNCIYYKNVDDMNADLLNHIENDTYIMIKSSHSSGLHKTVQIIKEAGL